MQAIWILSVSPLLLTKAVAQAIVAVRENDRPDGIVHPVRFEDFQFNPGKINTTVGDVIEWTWLNVIAHTSISFP